YGVPVSEIVEAIKHGVRKINIDTDIRLAMTCAIRAHMFKNPEEFDPRKYFADARKAAMGVCKDRFEAFGSAGQASRIKTVSMETMREHYAKGELTPKIN
ncbi:MAG: fructose-1,6-bisphosphate aldolase, partial [Ferrovum sp.]|nr:fructose-1,6-bisphosphate aldolase [Ferrovum sp.]